MDAKKPFVIMCAEAPFPGIEGRYTKCDRCAVEIFCSHSSLQAMKERGIPRSEVGCYCVECVVFYSKTDDDLSVMPMTEDQKQEVILSLDYMNRKRR